MFRPNPPRMITVIVAVALLLVGLAGTVVAPATVRDLVTGIGLPAGLESQILSLVRDRTVAYLCLLAAPMLLVIGSLLPGI
jgi:hypothetical protein